MLSLENKFESHISDLSTLPKNRPVELGGCCLSHQRQETKMIAPHRFTISCSQLRGEKLDITGPPASAAAFPNSLRSRTSCGLLGSRDGTARQRVDDGP